MMHQQTIFLMKKLMKYSLFISALLILLFNASAFATKISIPIPIPLLGDFGQAGLWFNGLPCAESPDISAIWHDNTGNLFFIIRGDITALYCWEYGKGNVGSR
ncbi:MAG: hypothetical protein FWF47_03825 [Clostridia bacterium]|nr:hypothetical protein [Clostridia bacterium]